MKICPVRADLFHVDRQTDMTKLTVAFRNCANAPNNCLKIKRAVSKYYIICASCLILIPSNLMNLKIVCLIYLLFIYWPCYWKRSCRVCCRSTLRLNMQHSPNLQTELLQMYTALCALISSQLSSCLSLELLLEVSVTSLIQYEGVLISP